ncbi:integrase family protein [Pseudomonas aeruginosa]|uniref:tyrosine-type recombinase/integrase n=1 Tax=Pseudomonas aeruginosa TaxID=287 RepID=UPI0010A2A874|nr:integrase family protein [Pseudomonas aeruginosa]EKX1998084.1 integrase family protein [Pseudomonas aeruginosa]EKX8709421.1 integrase family protein [Pseudomonas aeruginosa]MBI8609425.1 integrase family protein [Pseudomonas aeruginosa]MCV0278404.1 integrase family protein [Pseudomonas aeruginosa]MDY1504458.1 integrase family protein [Pseudomonas aeruginosa]
MAGTTSKTAARKHLTDIALKALKPGETATDPLPGRSSGALLFKCRASGAVEAYYRRRDNGLDQLIKLGVYKKTPKSPGLSLAELREQAAGYSRIAAEHGDIKAYLAKCAAEEEAQRAELQRERQEQQRLAEIEAAKGTLSELFREYIEDRRRNGVSAQQLDEFERVLRNDLEGEKVVSVGDDGQEQRLNVMSMKARDVRPDHVYLLIKPIWQRGAQRQARKVRSFLVAAFNFGLKAEHDIERSSNKSYGLQMNPADPVTVRDTSKPGERALTDQELKQFWQTITQVGTAVGPIVARVFHFAFATAGQRPLQFIREPWSSYNLKEKYVKVIDSKGRGGKPRAHWVPLSDRALQILGEVRALQPKGALYPWSTDGKRPIHSSSVSHAVAEWLETEHAQLGGHPVPKFTPKDIRRTCTQFMQRHGIKDFDSDVLQSHGQTGVVAKHYRNNPEAKLPDMRLTMVAFDAALGCLLDGEDEDEPRAEQLELFEIG